MLFFTFFCGIIQDNGNVEAQDFSEIRQQSAYQEFTTVFRNRVAANPSLLDDLVPNPENLSRQGNSDKSRLIPDPRFPWPPACQGCYKTLGC